MAASFGDALEALDEFRAELLHEQLSAPGAPSEAMAFRAAAGMRGLGPARAVHATGVGIPGSGTGGVRDGFVIKVYVFDAESRAAAAQDPFFARDRQGVNIDVEVLPMQVAFATVAQHRRRIRPVVGGVEIGPLGGSFVGTLGCFVRGGAGDDGPLFLLSNNHVLADVNRFAPGTPFTQPFSAKPADVIASLVAFEPILFPSPASQPRNVMDAAIAAVADPASVKLGKMLNVANYQPLLRAARPGMAVVKAGRTTGVTRGLIRAVRVRGVQVNYGTQQTPLVATFDNAIIISSGAGAFSAPGDSGSVILEDKTGQPVALLFAGNGHTTTACDLGPVCTRFGVRPV